MLNGSEAKISARSNGHSLLGSTGHVYEKFLTYTSQRFSKDLLLLWKIAGRRRLTILSLPEIEHKTANFIPGFKALGVNILAMKGNCLHAQKGHESYKQEVILSGSYSSRFCHILASLSRYKLLLPIQREHGTERHSSLALKSSEDYVIGFLKGTYIHRSRVRGAGGVGEHNA